MDDLLDAAVLHALLAQFPTEASARSLLRDVRVQVEHDVSRLAQAAAVGDSRTVRRAAHDLKGVASTVGARALDALAARIEREAVLGAVPDASVVNDLRDVAGASTRAVCTPA